MKRKSVAVFIRETQTEDTNFSLLCQSFKRMILNIAYLIFKIIQFNIEYSILMRFGEISAIHTILIYMCVMCIFSITLKGDLVVSI